MHCQLSDTVPFSFNFSIVYFSFQSDPTIPPRRHRLPPLANLLILTSILRDRQSLLQLCGGRMEGYSVEMGKESRYITQASCLQEF